MNRKMLSRNTAGIITPRLLSVPDAATYLGRTPKAIRRLIEKRELPVVRMGRRIHLDIRLLDRLIDRS